MPAGDGISKEILEQRRKVMRQSKRTKQKKNQGLLKTEGAKEKLNRNASRDEHGLSDEGFGTA